MRLFIENADYSGVTIGGASGVVINYDITEQDTYIAPDSSYCYFYNLQGGVGTTVDVENPSAGSVNLSLIACYVPVFAGDTIYLKTYGGNGGRAWALTDTSFNILSVAAASADCTEGITLTATANGYLFVTDKTSSFAASDVVIRRTIA